ncbi:MAG TPA: hypothetical protein VMT89_15025, partial [Candidatus Acidoferrales bacterium]|nr:hypothetical protein [Candidatus Acidoferrales bacterium]
QRVDAGLRQEDPIVTDSWWLPMAVAELFTTREMYFVTEPHDIVNWLPLAVRHGITSFAFASGSSFKPDVFQTPDIRPTTGEMRRAGDVYVMRFTIVDRRSGS